MGTDELANARKALEQSAQQELRTLEQEIKDLSHIDKQIKRLLHYYTHEQRFLSHLFEIKNVVSTAQNPDPNVKDYYGALEAHKKYLEKVLKEWEKTVKNNLGIVKNQFNLVYQLVNELSHLNALCKKSQELLQSQEEVTNLLSKLQHDKEFLYKDVWAIVGINTYQQQIFQLFSRSLSALFQSIKRKEGQYQYLEYVSVGIDSSPNGPNIVVVRGQFNLSGIVNTFQKEKVTINQLLSFLYPLDQKVALEIQEEDSLKQHIQK